MKVAAAIVTLLSILALMGATDSILAGGWSDPIPLAETHVAVPPALVPLGDAVHLFWLDRPSPGSSLEVQGEVWHAAMTGTGRILIRPHRVAADADTRLAWPVAVKSGSNIVAAWMTREASGVRLQVAVLQFDGTLLRVVSPGPAAEEAGRIAMVAYGDGVHVAWSQFDGGERRIWYARLDPRGGIDLEGRALADGDAPALSTGDALRLFWWQSAGPGTYRLMQGDVSDGRLEDMVALTGSILLVSPLPPLPLPTAGGVDVLVPTIERAFRTSGQLYLVRVKGGTVTLRVPLSAGTALSDVGGIPWSKRESGIIAWSQPAGRRQNAEIFAAVYDAASGHILAPSRVTYTASGSVRPAIAEVGGAQVAAWLETTGVAQFQLVAATSLGARHRRFLLGVPELDLSHPAQLAVFAATVIAGVLPYVALFAAAFALPALAVAAIAAAILGGFSWWQALVQGPTRRLALLLFLVLLAEIPARALIPGDPSARLLVLAMLVPALPALVLLSRRAEVPGITFLVIVGTTLALQLIAVLFPWGVQQLTQY